MRFSYQWLTEWVDTELTAEEAAERLTSAGLEVDDFTALGEQLDGVVVGRIVSCERHPDADRLQVCRVDAGLAEPLQIVCGAPNAREGLVAPVATIGSQLPNGMKIKAAKLRGVASQGMLCSSPELGIGEDSSGLFELPDALVPGTPLVDALGLPDHVIELDLTPNRADCLSIRGIAHELVALDAGALRTPAFEAVPATIERSVSVDLAPGAGCPRYVGRVIEGVDPTAPTPSWMVQRLERCGVRSLGPIVDVTNYVLLELGQPMHAFDLDRLDSGIRVRRAEAGERLKLLNDQEIELDPELLVIADHREPVALAGIMGGLPSSVQDGTRDILLESAWFDPAVIIGKARRFGLATDSSHRFERGVDPELQVMAIERATQLILEIAGGAPGPVVDRVEEADLPRQLPVALRPERVNHVLGTELDASLMHQVLVRLGMAVETQGDAWTVMPPSARRDLAIEEDLIEEIARVVGYDALPAHAPGGRLRAHVLSERRTPLDALGAELQARGFQEIISWSFVAEALLEQFGSAAQAQPLANPLSQDMAVLRTSLVPGLVQTVAANLRKQQARIRLYETGHVFEATDESFSESGRLALAMAGRARVESWTADRRTVDFFDVKGEVEQLLQRAGHDRGAVEFRPLECAWLHPGQSAAIFAGDRRLGCVGQLHPALAEKLDLGVAVFVAELELAPVLERELPEYAGLSKFPSVRRDLALAVPEAVASGDLVTEAKKVGGDLLRECIIFDTYEGKGIESGFKGIAIGLILRDVSRTLTDQDADRVVHDVVASLNDRFGVTLRG